MATNVRVIRSADFIRATPEGRADIEGAEKLIAQLAAASASLDKFHMLIDTRRVSGMLSASELWSLSEKLVRYERTFARRTAILCPRERFDHARFFALCADNRGYNITAFDNYEDAMEWLIGEDAMP